MNRPFYAFGMLLALLALAMVAVSSTARTRMVQSPQSRDKGSLLSPAPRGGTIFVVILPGADAPLLQQPVPSNAPSPAMVTESSFDACSVLRIAPVCVTEATCDAVAVFDVGSGDCRTHYDPLYDQLVYGDGSEHISSATRRGGQEAGPLASSDETPDDLILFRSLAAPSAQLRRLSEISLGWLPNRGDVAQLRKWLAIQVERVAWTRQIADQAAAITWPEYSELMQGLAPATELQASQPSENARSGAVRSSGWLLHFAVSSLSRAGVALQQAASHLEQIDDENRASVPSAIGE